MRIKLGSAGAALVALLFSFVVHAKPITALRCFKCHRTSGFTGRIQHSPVSKGRCFKCHSPHVSKYKHLLKEPVPQLCFSCHKDKSTRSGGFFHVPFKKGECTRCHAPHSSQNRWLLRKGLADTCFTCHKEAKKGFTYLHTPFKKGRCVVCHNTHRSSDYRLIKGGDPGVCLACHKDSRRFRKSHMGYGPVKMRCLTCHNPHGSFRRYLIRKNLHGPFAKGNCGTCHGKGAPKTSSSSMCFRCHSDVEKDFLTLNNHLIGKGDNPCLSCHSPHASDVGGLLLDDQGKLCRNCHAYTYERKEKSLYVHSHWDECANCHNPHGSNDVAMLIQGGESTCVRCHKTQGRFTHPVGASVKDPRNGQPVDCVTCHDPMGTLFKFELRLNGDKELCIQCHKGY